jgi:hypothetical protein
VLAAIGLLAGDHPGTAVALACDLLRSRDEVTPPAG